MFLLAQHIADGACCGAPIGEVVRDVEQREQRNRERQRDLQISLFHDLPLIRGSNGSGMVLQI